VPRTSWATGQASAERLSSRLKVAIKPARATLGILYTSLWQPRTSAEAMYRNRG
jgi:hypothetical protein